MQKRSANKSLGFIFEKIFFEFSLLFFPSFFVFHTKKHKAVSRKIKKKELNFLCAFNFSPCSIFVSLPASLRACQQSRLTGMGGAQKCFREEQVDRLEGSKTKILCDLFSKILNGVLHNFLKTKKEVFTLLRTVLRIFK